MDPEEFAAYLESLPDNERQQVLYDMGFAGATDTPWSFGESNEPQLDYGNYDLLQMGNVDIPELTSKGAVDPFDLTQQAKQVNLAQDYGALILDNILSAMSGPGAYDVGAFTPTYDYGEPLNLTGRRKAETRAQQGGYEGFLADQILNENLSPSEAEALMWSIVETPDDDPDLTDDDRARKKALLATLPKAPPVRLTGADAVMAQKGLISGGLPGAVATGQSAEAATEGRAQYDTAKVTAAADTVWNDLMEDPEFAYRDEATGQYYGRTPEQAMIKTPQMEFFDRYGLPYPTASYTDPKYLESSLNAQGTTPESRAAEQEAYDAAFAGLNEEVAGASDRYKGANTANQELIEAFRNAPGVSPEERQPYGAERFTQAQTPRTPITSGQAGAQITNQLRGLGQDVGPVTQPQFGEMVAQQLRDLGGTSAPTPPRVPSTGPSYMQSQGPFVSDVGGNITPYDFANPPEQAPESAIARIIRGTLGFGGSRDVPKTRRATQADLATQGKTRQDAAREVQRISGQRLQATYQDPRLAAITQGAYLNALAQQGRTPFNDAIALRRQGNRAIGV
jgi:hypothetical protein